MFLFCLFIIQPWFYPVVKYCFDAICFTSFIFVNGVIVSSNISCNDLSWNFIVMYVWYFVSWNSISVYGAIWPSLSPGTVINPILLTYLLTHLKQSPFGGYISVESSLIPDVHAIKNMTKVLSCRLWSNQPWPLTNILTHIYFIIADFRWTC